MPSVRLATLFFLNFAIQTNLRLLSRCSFFLLIINNFFFLLIINNFFFCRLSTTFFSIDYQQFFFIQILAYVGGPGGTGKSQVIKAIQAVFLRKKCSNWLRSGAYTGAAASNIFGRTISSLIGDAKTTKKKKNNESLNVSINCTAALEKNFSSCRFIIIDEVSMISTYMLAKMDARLKQAKKNTRPFGGLNMIFFGDFVQYPPVSGTALFKPFIDPNAKSDDPTEKQAIQTKKKQAQSDINNHTTGRNLWTQLNYAVFLTQQMRQKDETYGQILTDLRNNSTARIKHYFAMLQTRIAGPDCASDAKFSNFRDAVLITTRNAVRTAVNFAKTKSAAIQQSEKQIVILAHDSCKTTTLTPKHRIGLLHQLDNKCGDLIGMLSLVSGMPLVIKSNVATELGVCNGTRCKLSRVVFHKDQVPFDNSSTTAEEKLITKMPIMIIVKIDNPRFPPFDGLEPGEFPIFPIESYGIEYQDYVDGRQVIIASGIKRTQLPVLPGYALTGYTAQGATFDRAILDLTSPPKGCGKSNPADTYVLMSRMKTMKGLLILRPFGINVLQRPINVEMDNELTRLHTLAFKSKLPAPRLPPAPCTPACVIPASAAPPPQTSIPTAPGMDTFVSPRKIPPAPCTPACAIPASTVPPPKPSIPTAHGMDTFVSPRKRPISTSAAHHTPASITPTTNTSPLLTEPTIRTTKPTTATITPSKAAVPCTPSTVNLEPTLQPTITRKKITYNFTKTPSKPQSTIAPATPIQKDPNPERDLHPTTKPTKNTRTQTPKVVLHKCTRRCLPNCDLAA